MNIQTEDRNSAFPDAAGVMDLRTLVTRQLPQDLLSLNYGGVIGSNLFLEAQFSQRQFTFKNSGRPSTDLIQGTQLLDQETGALWWAPAFCGVCGDEERDNRSLLLKGSHFLSTPRGSHDVVFGYDTFNDRRRVQQPPDRPPTTGSTRRARGPGRRRRAGPPARPRDLDRLVPDHARRAAARTSATHSLFVNDTWR